MNRDLILGLAGLVALTVLASLGLLPGEAVVTFLGGLLMRKPEVHRP